MPDVAVPLPGAMPPPASAPSEAGAPAREGADGTHVLAGEAAFRVFYDATARSLRAYLRRVTGNATVADDLLQEAYLRLLRSGFVGSSEDHTRNYLFRVATNLLRDHFRRRPRETEALPESASAPETSAEVDLRADLQGALAELSPRERAMLWLAYVEGSSHAEIAAFLEVKTTSMKMLLFRARARLAASLRTRGLAPGAPGRTP